jgi:hypothetical protein
LFVEDAGDGLHSQRKAFDSGYVIDLAADYSKDGVDPVRFLAEGRDPLATVDSGLLALEDTGFQNDGDNEITGIHISDGDATVDRERLAGVLHPAAWREHHLGSAQEGELAENRQPVRVSLRN